MGFFTTDYKQLMQNLYVMNEKLDKIIEIQAQQIETIDRIEQNMERERDLQCKKVEKR